VSAETQAVLPAAQRRRPGDLDLGSLAVLRFDDEMAGSGLHVDVFIIAALANQPLKSRPGVLQP